jgi:hypothetical protein
VAAEASVVTGTAPLEVHIAASDAQEDGAAQPAHRADGAGEAAALFHRVQDGRDCRPPAAIIEFSRVT